MKNATLLVLLALAVAGCSSNPPIPEGQSPEHPRGVAGPKSQGDAQAMAAAAQRRMAGQKP